MPCQFCHSTGHTLVQCSADIEVFWGPIRRMVEQSPFALRHQYQLLSRLTCPMLKLINHRLGFVSSGNKLVLINQIVNHYFLPIIPNARINPLVQRPDIQLRASVLEGFMNLHMWSIRNEAERSFRDSGLIWLDMYHRNAFNESYAQALQNNISYPFDIMRQATQQLRDEAFARLLEASQEPRDESFARVLELGIVREIHSPLVQPKEDKSYLKKLKIKVKLDKYLEFKECFMCYDLKPHAKLGCQHEYCADCLVGTATVRTKTFITCAVCRDEIKEVKVLTKELKEDLVSQLKTK